MTDPMHWYYAPYHKDRLVWPMTEAEAAERAAMIKRTKRAEEVPTRLAAFQRVLDPDALPQAVVEAQAAWDQAQAAWNQAQDAWYKKAHNARRLDAWNPAHVAWYQASDAWHQAVRTHHAEIDAQRLREYPDAPPYDIDRGLILPTGQPCAD